MADRVQLEGPKLTCAGPGRHIPYWRTKGYQGATNLVDEGGGPQPLRTPAAIRERCAVLIEHSAPLAWPPIDLSRV